MREAREYTLLGMVQGVGMRWNAKRIADAHGLNGWVRNNPDGSVTVMLEGDDAEIDAFVDELNDRMGAQIAEFRQKSVKTGKTRDGFDVVY